MTIPPHPGKTPAQRKALDAIGCGDSCPPMARKTREALLAGGLIVQCGAQTVGRDRFGKITLPIFDMPIAVHMAWCEHWARGKIK